MKFRNDINSLRAFAVIAVLLYHFTPETVPSGFAGVDVFFVISGYLMTGIILTGIEKKKFNLLAFYTARANRILPALAILCLSLLVLGWFALIPTDYMNLAKHSLSSVSFISNITYYQEAGYFDAASLEKWLLHTWSLSVEWQFYIIYPLIILLLMRYVSIPQLKIPLITSTILCFILALIVTEYRPSASYYLLPTRAWEMLLGGLAFLYPLKQSEQVRRYIVALSALTITVSCFLFSNDTAWPGLATLLPTLGTYLIIVANYQGNFLFKNKLAHTIGKSSYSIYLWHWPLVVAGSYFAIEHWVVIGIPLSLAIGYLSYKYIEQVKLPKLQNLKCILHSKPAYLFYFSAIISLFIYKTEGAKFHYSEAVIIADNEAHNDNDYQCIKFSRDKTNQPKLCSLGPQQQASIVLIGDSHANSIASSLIELYNENDLTVDLITRADCPFLLNAKSIKHGDTCYKENKLRLNMLMDYKNTPIVISARWSGYLLGNTDPLRANFKKPQAHIYFNQKSTPIETLFKEFQDNLEDTICPLSKQSPVYIVQPIPEMRQNVPKVLAKNLLWETGNTDLSIHETLYFERNKKIREIITKTTNKCNTTVLDPYHYLCEAGRCKATHNGRPIYYDGDHMSEYGNKLLTPMFSKILEAKNAL